MSMNTDEFLITRLIASVTDTPLGSCQYPEVVAPEDIALHAHTIRLKIDGSPTVKPLSVDECLYLWRDAQAYAATMSHVPIYKAFSNIRLVSNPDHVNHIVPVRVSVERYADRNDSDDEIEEEDDFTSLKKTTIEKHVAILKDNPSSIWTLKHFDKDYLIMIAEHLGVNYDGSYEEIINKIKSFNIAKMQD